MSGLRSFFLVGPTAVGKSAIGHRIAQLEDLDILSADSMLVYKGLDIGTAKPTQEQRSAVRYWGMDLTTHSQPFSVAAYRRYAISALKIIREQNRTAVVIGGTGLYIKSLTHGIGESSPPNPEVRSRLLACLREGGTQVLQDMLKRDNTKLYDNLPDKSNPRRVIRALERTYAKQPNPVRDWQDIGHGPCIVGLSMSGDQLRKRILNRVEVMYNSGLIAEVRGLLSRGLESAPTALQAIGYQEAIDFIKGKCSQEDAIIRTATRTSQLAKKQFTWFRNQANVNLINIDIDDKIDTIIDTIKTAWQQHGPTPISE